MTFFMKDTRAGIAIRSLKKILKNERAFTSKNTAELLPTLFRKWKRLIPKNFFRTFGVGGKIYRRGFNRLKIFSKVVSRRNESERRFRRKQRAAHSCLY